MKFLALFLLLVTNSAGGLAQQPSETKSPPKETVAPANLPPPETQKIEAPASAPAPAAPKTDPGYMEPAQVKNMLHKIWLAEYRINDLLTQVHPEGWKTSEAARRSFNETLENLRKSLSAQEEWRAAFEKRTDSMYFGYQTYAAMGAALPRLDGVARSIAQFENPSFGLQYSQAQNQLFDLQQALQPYLAYLLRNQDQLLLATQTNLAGCQNELGYAMRGRTEAAKPMKNVLPELKGRHGSRHSRETAESSKPGEGPAKQAEKKTEKKSAAKPGASSKPGAAAPPARPGPKK